MHARKRQAVGVVSAIAVLALAGGVAAQFTTSTTSAPQNIGTGTLALILDNVSDAHMADEIKNLAPGDSVERFVDLRNPGTLDVRNIVVSQTNTGGVLVSPTGISSKFIACSVAWNYATGTCAGTQIDLTAGSKLSDWSAPVALGSDPLAAGSIVHLKLVTTLDKLATNVTQGASTTVNYTFTAEQRAGTAPAGTPGGGFDWGNTGNGGVAPDPTPSTPVAPVISTIPVTVTNTSSSFTLSWPVTSGLTYMVYIDGSSTGTPANGTFTAPFPAGSSHTFVVVGTKDGQKTAEGSGTASVAVNLQASTWSAASVLAPTSSAYARGSGTIGDVTYLFGGLNGSGIATAEKYDAVANTWTPLASMSTPRVSPASAAVAGKVYAFGGTKDGQLTSTSLMSSGEVFDPATGTWSPIAPMPTARAYANAVVVGTSIYMIGGNTVGGSQSAKVERYDTVAGTWSTETPLLTARADAAASVGADGNIYVFGGRWGNANNGSLTSSAEKYDVATKKWSAIAAMPDGGRRNAVAWTDADGKIRIMTGGYWDGSTTVYAQTMLVYDITTNKYTSGPSGIKKRAYAAPGTDSKGRLYLFGGDQPLPRTSERLG